MAGYWPSSFSFTFCVFHSGPRLSLIGIVLRIPTLRAEKGRATYKRPATAHDFRVISARTLQCDRSQRKRFSSN